VDEVVEAIAADNGAARSGLVGKDAHQDQVVLAAILLGHAALLVDGAFLLVATGVAKVADDSRAGRKRTIVRGGFFASHGKHYTPERELMENQPGLTLPRLGSSWIKVQKRYLLRTTRRN
jgi:hypothetical protein